MEGLFEIYKGVKVTFFGVKEINDFLVFIWPWLEVAGVVLALSFCSSVATLILAWRIFRKVK